MSIKASLDVIHTCARGPSLMQMSYRKPGQDWATDRMVEPYTLTHTTMDDFIVRTWQVSPTIDGDGWRNFRVDRITSCKPVGTLFSPREAITIPTGEVRSFQMSDEPDYPNIRANPSPPSARELYYRHLTKSLHNNLLSAAEQRDAKKLASTLTEDEKRAIHAMIYANLLNELSADGILDNSELDTLTTMRVWLTELGWCP